MRAPHLLPSLLSALACTLAGTPAFAAEAPASVAPSTTTAAMKPTPPPTPADNLAPTISSLTAVLDPALPLTATGAAIAVTWAAEDPGFAEAIIELSTDGGATYTPVKTVADHGTASQPVVRTSGPSTVFVRLVAKDKAGNRATSPAVAVEIPGSVDPAKALENAVGALPALAAVAPPIQIKPSPAPGPSSASTTTAAPQPEAEPVVVPEGSVLAGAPLLQEPAPKTPEGTVAEPAPGSLPVVISPRADPLGKTASGKASAAPAVIQAPSIPKSKRPTARTLAKPTGGFLHGEPAQKALAEARASAGNTDLDDAVNQYVRLIDSDQAATAVNEVLDLLAKDEDFATIIALADTLPPELKSDAVRLHLGNAQLALGQPDEAETAVSRIRKGSPLSRQALLVIAKARFSRGKIADYSRLIERLATGDDAVAEEAKGLRGK